MLFILHFDALALKFMMKVEDVSIFNLLGETDTHRKVIDLKILLSCIHYQLFSS